MAGHSETVTGGCMCGAVRYEAKGEVVKMSTRKANYITLDELIDEVGPSYNFV